MAIKNMEKRSLGNTNLLITPVGMGVLTVGRTQLNLPVKDGARIVRYALERGVNFLDTAEYYETYPYIREALRGTDFEPVIVSKSLVSSYGGMAKAIEDARAAIGRDVIDIFLLHEVRQAPDFENRAGARQCLIDAKAKGHVRAIGLSTHHVDAARLCAGQSEADILFPLINYKSLGIRNGANPGTKEDMAAAIKAAAEAGKGVFAMKAFGGGNLCADYTKAMDYVTGLPGVDSVMIGMGSESDADAAVDYCEGKLSADFRPDVGNKRMRVDQGDCEGCGACISRCTSKAIHYNENGRAEIDGTACVTCGYCAPICPVRAIIMF
ncbi:MAG: aldo/keto reductase [Clostridiales Family XIII bacterium]|nr:aldo/keto reductase [Clostridiales Family XIII bacterium]